MSAHNYINEKISVAMKEKVWKDNVEIQHYTFIEKSFINSLMNKERAEAFKNMKQEVAFNLH